MKAGRAGKHKQKKGLLDQLGRAGSISGTNFSAGFCVANFIFLSLEGQKKNSRSSKKVNLIKMRGWADKFFSTFLAAAAASVLPSL